MIMKGEGFLLTSVMEVYMAIESFSRTFTVNPDWGSKNLEKAIDNGSPTVKRLSTPEAKAKFKEATTMTPEKLQDLRRGMVNEIGVYGAP